MGEQSRPAMITMESHLSRLQGGISPDPASPSRTYRSALYARHCATGRVFGLKFSVYHLMALRVCGP